jgi:hypothetical protein
VPGRQIAAWHVDHLTLVLCSMICAGAGNVLQSGTITAGIFFGKANFKYLDK